MELDVVIITEQEGRQDILISNMFFCCCILVDFFSVTCKCVFSPLHAMEEHELDVSVTTPVLFSGRNWALGSNVQRGFVVPVFF